MDAPKLQGLKRSPLFFDKIDIFNDRMETKALIGSRKIFPFAEITSWTEVNKKQRNSNISWIEFTVYTAKSKYMINSLHWKNFNEMKALLSAGKPRDTEKEAKLYGK